MSSRPVIIVGTGRCGSTLLSNMVRLHPDMLSVSELFSFVSDLGNTIEYAFPSEPLSGTEFWSILAHPLPRQSILLANGLQMPEVVYPWERGRFTPDALPPILQGMVPHLDADDPDALFDRLHIEVSGWPEATAPEHYNHLFDVLVRWHGKRQWVERSGGSLRVVERLIETFPNARFVHLVRDGRDTALSMSRHIGFRMALLCGLQHESLGLDPFESTDRTDEADLSDELVDTLPENFSDEAFNRFDLPPSLCGHYWSGEIVAGLNALDSLPAESVLTLRYDDVLANPEAVLRQFGEFTGGGAPASWVAEAASLVRQEAPRWPNLPSNQRGDLSRSCEPGFRALALQGASWAER